MHELCIRVTDWRQTGPSGGGKSSIVSMISRFYDPNLGTISLDGRDIRSIPLDEYRSHIALVAQDAVLSEVSFRIHVFSIHLTLLPRAPSARTSQWAKLR